MHTAPRTLAVACECRRELLPQARRLLQRAWLRLLGREHRARALGDRLELAPPGGACCREQCSKHTGDTDSGMRVT
jgi:hypothetical protein